MKNGVKVLIALTALVLAMLSYEAYHSKHYLSRITGHSMQAYGIVEGDLTTVYINRTPKVGDIINFRCTDYRKCPTHDMAKLVKRIDDKGCYWVEGNGEPWYNIYGAPMKSLDSRSYGWLCKDDIKFNGVVEKNNNSPVRESFVDAKCVPPTQEDTFHETVCKRP